MITQLKKKSQYFRNSKKCFIMTCISSLACEACYWPWSNQSKIYFSVLEHNLKIIEMGSIAVPLLWFCLFEFSVGSVGYIFWKGCRPDEKKLGIVGGKMRGIFLSLAKRTCAIVLIGCLFCSTLRPVLSKAIRPVACVSFVHQGTSIALCSLEMLSYCFAFQKQSVLLRCC